MVYLVNLASSHTKDLLLLTVKKKEIIIFFLNWMKITTICYQVKPCHHCSPKRDLVPLDQYFQSQYPSLSETLQDLNEHLPESATTDKPGSLRQSCSKSGVINRVDYKYPRKPGKALLIFHNIYHAKRISPSHIHMVWVLSALANGDNICLGPYSEPQNY